MKALIKYQNSLVESNRKEYGAEYDSLNFVNYYQGLEMEGLRSETLSHLADKISWDFKNTKTDATSMSPGCRLCGMGQWSCLFINGKCNCNCFYCPAPQTDIGQPVTQTLTFEDPIGYADYIKKFGFKGVSFSGGEPFLTFDKVKRFLSTLRQELPADLYIWMYTNGTRVTQDQLHELAALGLNEIRYDIGATDYNLKPVKQAIGIIPIVSVEIPAVPDELETIKNCVKELAEAGLSYLNLHQLRLTPHNLQNIKAKGYNLSHGQRVTVPASELAALEVIKFTKDNNIALPVNYCSFVYKNRFQKSGLRKKLAPMVMDKWQSITENGYLRSIAVETTKLAIEKRSQLSIDEAKLTFVDEKNNEIKIDESLIKHFNGFDLKVRYTDVRILDGQLPQDGNLKNIVLADGKQIHIEWADISDALNIPPTQHAHFTDICNGRVPEETFDSELLFKIKQLEQIEEGLSEIY